MNAFRTALKLAAAVVLPLVLSVGCASRVAPLRTVRVAVIDGPVLYEVSEKGEVVTRGWWLGANDRFKSPNTGTLIGEALAREIDRVPGVEVYSREDLQIYLSQKERLLRRRYPGLNSEERKQILVRQDPLDFGRSLNVDYVIAPSVIDSTLVVNRTFSWWYGHLSANVQVYDVATGQAVFGFPWEKTEHFTSELSLMERYARNVSRAAVKADVFRLEQAP